jgi:hypothetical protein
MMKYFSTYNFIFLDSRLRGNDSAVRADSHIRNLKVIFDGNDTIGNYEKK